MRCWCFVLVAALGGAGLRAERRAAQDEPHWASLSAPLRAGELELLGGLGGESSGSSGVGPALVLAVRRGITDNLQLSFPLLATLSADIDGVWPRLSLTTGLGGVGYRSDVGFFAVPMAEAAAHFVGKRRLVVLHATGSGMMPVIGDSGVIGSVGGGFGYRLDDVWSVGFGAKVALTTTTALETRTVSATLGTWPSYTGTAVPTVRWLANNVLSFELWTLVATRYVVEDEASVTTTSGLLTATGHF